MRNIALFSFAVLFTPSCWVPTAEDEARLKVLRAKYSQYEFVPDGMYLQLRGENVPSHDEAAEIWSYFILDEQGKERGNSSFVYLNVYDKRGSWKGQYFWRDSKTRVRFEFEHGREYH